MTEGATQAEVALLGHRSNRLSRNRLVLVTDRFLHERRDAARILLLGDMAARSEPIVGEGVGAALSRPNVKTRKFDRKLKVITGFMGSG
jgi:hypothetical protein